MTAKTKTNWQTMRLGDFADVNPSVPLERGKKYLFMDMSNVVPLSRTINWPEQKEFSGSGSHFQDGDTLFARITPCLENGKITQARNINNPGFGSTEFYILRGRENVSDSDFVFYLARTYDIRKRAEQSMVGASGRQRVERAAFESISVSVPSDVNEQKRIAEILSAFDGKIENNNHIIKALEEMAQAIFKERLTMPIGALARKGQLPKGWKTGSFTEFIDVLGGGTPSTTTPHYWNGNIPFFTPKDAGSHFYGLTTEKHITKEGLENCSSPLYSEGTVFVTARGTVGKVVMAGVPMAMNQSCYALRGKTLSNLLVFLIARSLVNSLQQHATGGVFDAIVTTTFERMNVIVPDQKMADSFDEKLGPLFSQIRTLQKENQKLATIRDLLLPRLMSGEIRV